MQPNRPNNYTPASVNDANPQDPNHILNSGDIDNTIPGFPESAVDVSIDDQIVQIGETGTVIVSGVLTDQDYNPELAGRDRVRIYDQMRLGDATVRAALQAVKLPILSANWYVEAPEGNGTEDPITKFIDDQLFNNPNFTWTKFLRQVLTMCDYGNAIFEKVFCVTADGNIGWSKFSQRLTKTIYRWTFMDGVTPGVTQIIPAVVAQSGGNTREIPKWKLMYFIHDIEGSNYDGISLLRNAYQHWYFKGLYYKIDAMAMERQGLGLPIIHTPPNANANDRKKAVEIAKNLRANEKSYAEMPQGFSIEMLDMKSHQLKSPKDMVAHHDRQISKAVLAQFLELGGTAAGSFALSADQSELFLLGLNYIAKLIREEVNKSIQELVILNFGVQEKYPSLEFARIGQVNFEKLAMALFRLAQGGLISPDEELERHIREQMDLPEPAETSEGDHVDPDSLNYTVPQVPKQVKLPIQYANEKRVAKEFIEDAMDLRADIEKALQHEQTNS